MTTMNISLPESLRRFVEEEVAAGGYGSASEFLRELIREAQKRKTEAELERRLLDGLKSGEPVEMTPEDWKEMRRQVRERAKRSRRDGRSRRSHPESPR